MLEKHVSNVVAIEQLIYIYNSVKTHAVCACVRLCVLRTACLNGASEITHINPIKRIDIWSSAVASASAAAVDAVWLRARAVCENLESN